MILTVAPFLVSLTTFLAFEVLVRPEAADRAIVAFVLGILAVMVAIAGVALPRLMTRLESLSREIFIVALAAMMATALAVIGSASLVMLSPSEVRAIFVLALSGVSLGLVLELTVARSIERDLRRMYETATRIGSGDLSARTEFERRDEIGQAGRAIDRMAHELESVATERATARTARTAFLTAVSHDLRTPLAALQASFEAIEDGLAVAERHDLSAIRGNLATLSHLIDDLFLLARIETNSLEFNRTRLDLAELADEAIEAIAPLARRRLVRPRLEADGPVPIVADEAQLSRAIRNILDNAIRYAPKGTEILVEVRAVADGCLVRVVDEGPGIPEDRRERLFGGYPHSGSGSSETTGGAGFGLAIAEGLVKAHGGRLWIEPGPGGRVAFLVPAAD